MARGIESFVALGEMPRSAAAAEVDVEFEGRAVGVLPLPTTWKLVADFTARTSR